MTEYFPLPEIPEGWKVIPIGTVLYKRYNAYGYLIRRRLRYQMVFADGCTRDISRREAKQIMSFRPY